MKQTGVKWMRHAGVGGLAELFRPLEARRASNRILWLLKNPRMNGRAFCDPVRPGQIVARLLTAGPIAIFLRFLL